MGEEGEQAMRRDSEVRSQKSEVTDCQSGGWRPLLTDLRPRTSDLCSPSPVPCPPSPSPRPAFTLTELLIVIMIVGIMAGLALSALNGATELAREQRTRAIIAKLDQLIMERYEGYRTRAVPLSAVQRANVRVNPRLAARSRLDGLRELMRMELPCCQGDVIDDPVFLASVPALTRSYRRRVTAAWYQNDSNKEAECLYLIVSTMQDGDKNALDFFFPEEIGDLDGDGVKEILDGWGEPLVFFRWAPGYAEQPGADGAWGKAGVDDDLNNVIDDVSEAGWQGSDDILPLPTMQTRKAPDPFDPLRVDPRSDRVGGLPAYPPNTGVYQPSTVVTDDTFALMPLIVSKGRNKQLGLQLVPGYPGFRYSTPATYTPASAQPSPPNDPYWAYKPLIGSVLSVEDAADNITNHYQVTP
jgi:prepilin-type N-terminal cleavage/methylation domain-containing protein